MWDTDVGFNFFWIDWLFDHHFFWKIDYVAILVFYNILVQFQMKTYMVTSTKNNEIWKFVVSCVKIQVMNHSIVAHRSIWNLFYKVSMFCWVIRCPVIWWRFEWWGGGVFDFVITRLTKSLFWICFCVFWATDFANISSFTVFTVVSSTHFCFVLLIARLTISRWLHLFVHATVNNTFFT